MELQLYLEISRDGASSACAMVDAMRTSYENSTLLSWYPRGPEFGHCTRPTG